MGKEHEKAGPRTTTDKKSTSVDTNGYPDRNPGRQYAQVWKPAKESDSDKSRRTQADGLS